MPFASRRADLLERSLQGLPCTDQEVRSLVATVSKIPALTSAACAPRDEFVSALGLRLRAEALVLPARPVPGASSATETRSSATKPVVFVIGRGLRVLAGATASLLLVGAVIGFTSRSALPGGLLYPVKQMLNSAAVQLAGSELDRGVTLLSQAQEHVGEARSLVERDRAAADPASVNQALRSAYDSAVAGQGALLGEFDRTRDTRTLIAIQDFTARAMPQLNALRPQVPAASRPDVDALIALLRQTQTTLTRTVALCGKPCDSIGGVNVGGRPSSGPPTGKPLAPLGGGGKLTTASATGGLRIPGLPTDGLSIPGPVTAVTGPGAVVMAPAAPTLPTSGGTILPPVTVGSLTVKPSPIVVPHLSPPVQTPPLPSVLPLM